MVLMQQSVREHFADNRVFLKKFLKQTIWLWIKNKFRIAVFVLKTIVKWLKMAIFNFAKYILFEFPQNVI